MKRVLLGCSALLAAAAVVVPAASAGTSFTVRAGGYVLDNKYAPKFTTPAHFTINLKAGPGHKVTYIDNATGLSFRSLDLTSLTFSRNAVRIKGIGFVGGKRVHFTALATDYNKTGTDVFRIAWDHKASHGGIVHTGNVRITPVSVS